MDPFKLNVYFEHHNITYSFLPTQFCEIFINEVVNKSLRNLLTGGDKLRKVKLHDYNLINVYGPTEATIHVSTWTYQGQHITTSTIPIGRPIINSQLYILDHNLTPLPIGAIGELYIGGVGLARGYLNRPDLTAEKFITNPFQTKAELDNKSYGSLGKNSRLYKTGDLVRYLPDGNLEYIGRNDFQVKIRGYRIELGEIETVLASYSGVVQSVVLAKEHIDVDGVSTGNKYLVGYYVSDSKLDEENILNYLRSRLPEYMVPSLLLYIEKLPLTINGNLDRNALPEPEFTSNDSYVAPRNELEQQVCQILSEVLGLPEDKVGIRDDFFRLGGDSIISIQLISRLRQKLGVNVSVKDIFSYKSIERLYDNVLSKKRDSSTKLTLKTEQGTLSGEVPLLPIQEWFFQSNFEVVSHWNQSFIIKVPNLDIDMLQLSITKLVEHHDCFKMRYKKVKDLTPEGNNDHYTQYYNTKTKENPLQILDIRTLEAKEGSKEFEDNLQAIFTNWQSEFDLENGPIYSIGYICGYADGSSRVYFALHHLIVDTVSWRVLLEDLRELYSGKELGSKGSSYRQWVNAVKEYAKTHEDEKTYWTNILSDYDHNKLDTLMLYEQASHYTSLELTQEQTNKLLRETNKAYNTQVNDILLTALGCALSEIMNNRVNYILLEGHGREEIDNSIDITRTLGWFTTMYPVRLEVSSDIGDSIKNIKESLRQIPNKGIGYGTLIGYKTSDLPRISFNYLGQFDQDNKSQELDSFWSIINEDSGVSTHFANRDCNILNINGLVINGSLRFDIASRLDENTTNRITMLLKQKLNDTITYATSQNRSYLTASDINNIINQEYLDKLQEKREIEGVYLANSLQ